MVDDNSNNVIVFLRRDRRGRVVVCAVNFSPVTREGYRFGVPPKAEYREVLNTDDLRWGGSGVTNPEPVAAEWIPSHGKPCSISLRLPPLGAVFLQGTGRLKQPPKRKEKTDK